MTITADLSTADLLRLAQAAHAEPACQHPRCGDGIHWAEYPSGPDGEYAEEGYCPLDVAS